MRSTARLGSYKLILSGLIIASILAHGWILWNSRSYIASGRADFAIFYTGAQILFAGRGGDLYNPKVQRLYQEKIAASSAEWNLPFNHAPYELLIFWPLSSLSYPAAHLTWAVANLVLLAFTYRYLAPFIDPANKLLLGALLFAFYPTMVTLQMGQDSILTLFILVVVFVSLQHQRDSMAGIVLACGLYKPQLVLPIAGLLIMEKRWHAWRAFVATTMLLAALCLALTGVQAIWDYVALLQYDDYVIYPRSMSNIRGLFHIALNGYISERTVALLAITASSLLYAGSLYICRHKSGPGDSRFELKFSLVCITTVLASYHLYSHDLLLLMAPIMLLLNSGLRGEIMTGASRVIVFALVLVFSIPVLPSVISHHRQSAWGALLIALLYFAVSFELYARRKATTSARLHQALTSPTG
jgi:Glycosyltransferase family 87